MQDSQTAKKKKSFTLEIFHVYPFAVERVNTMLMSSTPPQGQESINFDKQKDLDCTEASVPKNQLQCNLQIRGSLNLKSNQKFNWFPNAFTMTNRS